jgi:potassium voltage-gated channel Shal-related subfamily D protein 2
MFRLLRVFRPFRYNNTLLLWAHFRPIALTGTEGLSRTIEVMYVSVRRSRHALLAIGFFALFVVILFSTLLLVHSHFVFLSHVLSIQLPDISRNAEHGTAR